jgi:hypothetical protein
MTPARFRWGMIFIQIGILFLLQNAGILNESFWYDLFILSPFVLIAVGLEKIFTKSKLQFISYTTTFALFFGGFAIAILSGTGSYGGNFFAESTYQEDYDTGINRIKAVLDVGNADLTIRDSGDDLIYAHFDRFTVKPEINLDTKDSLADIEFSSRTKSFLGGAIRIEIDEPQDWNIRFHEELPLDLECYGENADLHLNFSTSYLENLKLDADNTTIYLKLGELVPRVSVTILGDDSRLRLRVPSSLGVKIHGDDYNSYLDKIGMIKIDSGVFITEGFDSLQNQIDVKVDDRLSSFSIDYF